VVEGLFGWLSRVPFETADDGTSMMRLSTLMLSKKRYGQAIDVASVSD